MIRVVRNPDGSLAVGRTLPGRGAWLCRDRPACVDLAARRKAFERALRGPLAADSVAALRKALDEPAGGTAAEGSEGPVP